MVASSPEIDRDLQLGRFKNSLSMGILGLPNVGKSTLFNLLTHSSVLAANYPFATKEPHKDMLSKIYIILTQPSSRCVDIAGLVRGASNGEGLGNAFLSNISAVDGLYHVCRIFDSEEITHVEGEVDPIRDMKIIHNELLEKDISNIKKRIESLARLAKGDKLKKFELDCHEKLLAWLQTGKDARFGQWSGKEIQILNQLNMLTAKPIIYLINMSEEDYLKQKNKWLPKIKAWVEARNSKDPIVPFSAEVELKLIDMTPEQAAAYCKERKTRSMLSRIIKMGYTRLRLISFFTCGPDEVKAWTIHTDTKAPQAAGTIHTDFEKKFICAEVMHYNELKECGSEGQTRSMGKVYQQGKNYLVEDGDIILFKHNAGGAGKK